MTAPKHVLCGSFDDRNGLLLSARKQLVIRTGANRCKWAKVLFNDHIPDSIFESPAHQCIHQQHQRRSSVSWICCRKWTQKRPRFDGLIVIYFDDCRFFHMEHLNRWLLDIWLFGVSFLVFDGNALVCFVFIRFLFLIRFD